MPVGSAFCLWCQLNWWAGAWCCCQHVEMSRWQRWQAVMQLVVLSAEWSRQWWKRAARRRPRVHFTASTVTSHSQRTLIFSSTLAHTPARSRFNVLSAAGLLHRSQTSRNTCRHTRSDWFYHASNLVVWWWRMNYNGSGKGWHRRGGANWKLRKSAVSPLRQSGSISQCLKFLVLKLSGNRD